MGYPKFQNKAYYIEPICATIHRKLKHCLHLLVLFAIGKRNDVVLDDKSCFLEASFFHCCRLAVITIRVCEVWTARAASRCDLSELTRGSPGSCVTGPARTRCCGQSQSCTPSQWWVGPSSFVRSTSSPGGSMTYACEYYSSYIHGKGVETAATRILDLIEWLSKFIG